MEKQNYLQRIIGMVKWFLPSFPLALLPFFLFTFLPLPALAQGLPLIRNYTAAEYGGHNNCYDIEIGVDGTVFVANFEGLLYYDRARWRIIHTPDISRITVVYRDSKNTVWVGGYNHLFRLQERANGDLFLQQVGHDGQFKGEVMEVFEDGGSLLFVASDNNVYEVNGSTISFKEQTSAKFSPGVASSIVSLGAVKEGSAEVILDDITQTENLDGGLQVKVKKNSGLIIADAQGHELYTITEDNGLCSNQVAYVAYDGHGLLWGATLHGVFSIEIPSLFSYFMDKDGLDGEVHTITAFDGKMYVGTTNGLYSIAIPEPSMPVRSLSYQCKRIAEIKNICWTLAPSRDELLAATSSGIYKIARGGKVSRLTSNSTTALLVDGDKVYAGEPDGVYVYLPDFLKRTKVNDIPLATDIRKNAQGGLWSKNVHGQTVGDDPGMIREPLADLPAHLKNPLSDIEVTAQYRYGSQTWIGGDEILVVVDTGQKDLARLSDCRTVHFRSIIMGNDSVLWGGYGEIPQELPKLADDERHLHFFYALDYTPLTGKTLYRYRLNNDKWSAWSEKQSVEFLNLPYGSFTLSVQARLANGELSEIASVDFSIAYPLFMRWYMVVIYFILLACLVYLLFRYRLKKLEKDKIKLERVVEERTADLRQAQQELIRQEKMASVGKLTEGLIDRLLNPMNYIINFSKMSNDLLKDFKEAIGRKTEAKTDGQVVISDNDYEDMLDIADMLTENLRNVDDYGQNATRMLKAMEEMLKDRQGGYTDMDLLPVLHQNEEMFAKYYVNEKEKHHIRATFTLPDSAMPLNGNPALLSKVFMNILGNAVYAVVRKAERTKGFAPEISLAATVVDGQYVVTVRDNGIGIDEKQLDKIFNPFFTTKTTSEAAGIGLYLSREVIQNHGGDISVESRKDEYTEFTISLPKVKK